MNNFAVTSAGLGEALKRSASALDLAGNSIQETAGMVTGIAEVTQDPEKAGNALKVLSLRLRGMKGQLEELGEETDENVENISKMQGQILNMTGGKVNIFDGAGNFKSTYEIMKGIAEVWDDLSSIDQADLLETIAGKHRANDVAALLSNWQNVEAAVKSASEAEGSASRENAKYVDSIQGRLDKLTTAWQSFANTFMSSDFLKGLISGLTTVVEILEWIIDNFGLIGTISLGVAGKSIFGYFKGAKEVKKTLNDVVDAINSIPQAMTNVTNAAVETTEAMSNVASATTESVESASNLTSASTEAAETITNTTSAMTEATEASANLASTTTEVGEATVNMVSTTTEAVEATGNLASASTEAAEAMANMTSAGTEAAETTANLASGTSEFVEAAGNTASMATEAAETISNLGDAAVTAGASATKGAGGFKTFFGTLAGKIAVAAAVVTAISLVVNAIKNAEEEEARLRQETIKASDEFLGAANSFELAYAKYSDKTNLTSNEEAELETAVKGTVNALNDKSDALHRIVNNSKDYLSSLESIKNAELIAAESAAIEKRDAAEKDLKKSVHGWNWDNIYGSKVDIAFNYDDYSKEAKIAQELGSEYWTSSSTLAGREHYNLRLKNSNDTKGTLKYYDFLQDYRDELKEDELTDTNKYKQVEQAINEMSEAVETYRSGVYEAAKAQYQLNEGIPKTVDEYFKMRNAILNSDGIKDASFGVKSTYANEMDSLYGQAFVLTTNNAQSRKFVGVFDNYGDEEANQVETFLNMRTAVNNNECTVGQYMSEFNKVNDMAEKWSEDERNEFNTTLGFDTDKVKKQYDEVYNYLVDKKVPLRGNYENTPEFRLEKDNIRESEIKGFLNGLTVYELEAFVNLKPELDFENDSWDEIEAKIQEEAKLIEAISFNIDITDVTEKLEKLSAAMSESVSGSGLTSESMTAIEDMFGDLDGYDPSKLFERTATGMRLNTTELNKLNSEFRNTNVDGLENKMSALGEKYLQTREELSGLTYGTDEYNQKAKDLSNIEAQINATETLIAQYDGLTNAYQEWQRAESAGNQRDMYENVISGFETVKDELSRGWADDGTVEFLELITGKTNLASKSAKELKQIWKDLDKNIEHTSYSVRDFFTVDEDGNSTSQGVYNFLDAIGQMEEEKFGGKDVVKRDKKGNIIAFDFQVAGGDKAIADALGISEELVQIMLRAADDAGFVVSMDGTYQQLDVLKEKAQEAANKLKDTFKLTDYEFNLDTTKTTGEGSLAGQYEKASNIWEQFKKNKNQDGTVNMDVKGAEEAYTLVSTLQSMIDKLSEPVYMKLDASQVEKDIQTPLSKLQEYETLVQSEHQLQLKGTDTTEIDKAQKEIVDYFESLDDKTKIKLGIEGLSREEIEAKIEKGEIEIPASVDIQMNMSDDIKDMKLLMMNELELISDEEVKLKVGYQIDDSLVDTLNTEEKEVVINFISKNEEWFNKLSEEEKEVTVKLIAKNKEWYEKLDDDEKEIIVDLVSSGVDIETLTNDETKKIIVDFVANNEKIFDKLDDKEKKIFVKYIEENKGVWEELSEDDREIIVELIASGVDLETLTDKEKKEVIIDFVTENDDGFNELEDEEKEVVVDLVTDDSALKALEEHGVEIEAFCNIFGVEKVDDLKKRLEGLDDEQILVVAQVLGKINVDKLKTAMDGLEDEDVKAIAKAIGEGDVKALRTAVFNLEDKEIEAIAKALGYEDVGSLKAAMDNLTDKDVQAIAQTLGITDVDSLKAAIDRLSNKDVKAIANVDGKDDVNGLKSAIDNLKGKTVTVWASIKKKASSLWDKLTGGGTVDGTAHVNGTAFANGTISRSGKAYKQGDWGTKDSGVALGGEEAPELLVRNGKWHLIGEKGAEFFGYRKGDIIFNASQTREIFEKGKITHGNGRGKALVSGTAFSTGTGGGFWTNSVTGTTYRKSSSSSDSKDDFEETIDLIEIALKRIQREIDNLDQKVNNVYKSWDSRNTTLSNQINKVGNEIVLQQKAANEYLKAANGVGLSSDWVNKIKNGKVDIETVKDEVLAEKIKDFQDYYEKYLACIDAAEELKKTEASLYAQRFENIQTQYDGILQGYEHAEAMLNEYISQAEAQGHLVSKKYYQALISNEKSNIAELKKEQSDLIAERDNAVADGKITKYSEEWYNMCSEIDSVTQAIEEGATALLEYDNAMRDIDWQVFDLIQERISDVTSETEFLIELMSNKDLFDDNGKLTEQGAATMGLHALNYNTSMYQSDEYGKEIAKLDKQIAKDPYNQELINRRRELVELQRESILEAENQKNAIKDLVEDGINKELDALQERIDLHNEELDSMKDLYDYQKNVEEQTENIASLRKQLDAYEGFDDEETRAKVQELKVSLEEAEADLKETEWDKYIQDTQQILDTLYTDYETILNTRLDNIDFLLSQVIDGINTAAILSTEHNSSLLASLGSEGTLAGALGVEGAIASAIVNAMGENGSIKGILNKEVTAVGTKLSTAMNSIWSVGEGNAKSVLTMYGEGFQKQQTTTNATLNSIKADVNAMVDDIDKDAKKKTTANKTTTSAKKDPTKTTTTSTTSKPSTSTNTTTTKSSGDGKPKVGDKVKFISGKYYYDSQGKKPLGSKYQGKEVYITNINTRSWATHPYHISTGTKLGKGDLGWLKLNQLSGYATGKKNFANNEWAWTQENGQEYIVRPSDGAILTPIARKGSVLNAEASNNLWNMTNNPAEFIKDNLRLDTANIPNGANVQNSCIQNFENITFSMPNVHSYNELVSEMQRDPKFEKLIHAMTVDQIAGKSKLGKNKAIR